MHFDSAVRAAFSHALTMFPVQKPSKNSDPLEISAANHRPFGGGWGRRLDVRAPRARRELRVRIDSTAD